jgi:hypothetical protein
MSDDKKKLQEVQESRGPSREMIDAVAIAAGVAADAAVKALRASEPKAPPSRKRRDMGSACSECGQLEIACKKQHRMIVLFPKYGKAKSFPGVTLNGVTYKSDSPRHLICVPARSNMESTVALWDEGEERLFNARSMTHDSGSIGTGNLSNFKPA